MPAPFGGGLGSGRNIPINVARPGGPYIDPNPVYLPSPGIPSSSMGAGQGPTPATGQLADNPFQNSFNFQIPQFTPTSDGTGTNATPSSGGGGFSQYLPLIIVGLIVAGGAYFLFERKK